MSKKHYSVTVCRSYSWKVEVVVDENENVTEKALEMTANIPAGDAWHTVNARPSRKLFEGEIYEGHDPISHQRMTQQEFAFSKENMRLNKIRAIVTRIHGINDVEVVIAEGAGRGRRTLMVASWNFEKDRAASLRTVSDMLSEFDPE